jgi:5'(3')-deoxyribonucleotidase
MNKNYTIYCDLDGVLTDFNGDYKILTGIDISNESHTHKNNKEFFEPIDKAGKNFWSKMNWTKDGKVLWNYIKKYNPELLSAPTRENSSRVGKMEWVEKELPGVHLILRSASNKKEFANKNSILIDDRPSNIEDWKENGGIGILHKSTNETIKELKMLNL